VKLGTLKIL